ncbi:MAG: hypothetical protein MRJ92_02730 [Nitrospira sp.]|nr:hypothetical protein [Nitrospira sp.]
MGIFGEAEGSGFDSEVWGDAEQMMTTFHRTAFSSMTLRLADPEVLPAFRRGWKRDPDSKCGEARAEVLRGKGRRVGPRLIRVTAIHLTVVFSVGAILGAAMTMSPPWRIGRPDQLYFAR